jgi:hypothetical protein
MVLTRRERMVHKKNGRETSDIRLKTSHKKEERQYQYQGENNPQERGEAVPSPGRE